MYDMGKRSDDLENAAGLYVHIHGPIAKWRHWGMFIHWRNKFHVPPNAV